REGDPLDLPQARTDVGDGGAQAGEGRDPLPRRERLATSRHRQGAAGSNTVTVLLDRQPAAESFDTAAKSLDASVAGDDLEDERFLLVVNRDCRPRLRGAVQGGEPAKEDGRDRLRRVVIGDGRDLDGGLDARGGRGRA